MTDAPLSAVADASSSGWIGGASLGFATAFLIQALSGHWKLWVDQRKALCDDLIKALDSAKTASVGYFEQPQIPAGANNEKAREVVYTQKVVADLFGTINTRFGPVSKAGQTTFREFRELTTGEGFLRQGVKDGDRVTKIAIASASCAACVRDWHCEQLGPLATVRTFLRRWWSWTYVGKISMHSQDIQRLTR
jgi:hypothetical protein